MCASSDFLLSYTTYPTTRELDDDEETREWEEMQVRRNEGPEEIKAKKPVYTCRQPTLFILICNLSLKRPIYRRRVCVLSHL